MSFLDSFINKEKTSKLTIKDPRKVFEDILKQASGTNYTRDVKYNIYYQVIAFKGVTEGVGTSTIVANTAIALAQAGLTICVIDPSILSPVQDILLKTNLEVEDGSQKEPLDWFDLPFTRQSVLHSSKLSKNISVLSFKGKNRTIVDLLSSNDNPTLVTLALSTFMPKFDLILIDCCSEQSEVNTACLQQAQKVIQVWNDSPQVLGNIENFITNTITLSCSLDKMRNVIFSKMCKQSMGTIDSLLSQYRLNLITKNYVSDELYLKILTSKYTFDIESTDPYVAEFTQSIIDVTLHLLNKTVEEIEKPKKTKDIEQPVLGVDRSMVEVTRDPSSTQEYTEQPMYVDHSMAEATSGNQQGYTEQPMYVEQPILGVDTIRDPSSTQEYTEHPVEKPKKKGLFGRRSK